MPDVWEVVHLLQVTSFSIQGPLIHSAGIQEMFYSFKEICKRILHCFIIYGYFFDMIQDKI